MMIGCLLILIDVALRKRSLVGRAKGREGAGVTSREEKGSSLLKFRITNLIEACYDSNKLLSMS